MTTLEATIEKKIGEVRTGFMDITLGEISNMHQAGEIVIQPEYQRLFRWTDQQKSHLIESIILELPIPQIFTIENSDGVLELIDGLQRVSSILQFIKPESIGKKALVLKGCSLVPELNGKSFEGLPKQIQLALKRSTLRAIIIKKQSKAFLRYEMFKRLNTGGTNLEPQEIRNCSARMLGDGGVDFYDTLTALSRSDSFKPIVDLLPDTNIQQRGGEELVLRYFAVKNYRDSFSGSVRDWLDAYMEDVLLGRVEFDKEAEARDFESLFSAIIEKVGPTVFLRHRNGSATGALPPAYFEAIALGIANRRTRFDELDGDEVLRRVTEITSSSEFRAVTGPGANSKDKLKKRINLVSSGFDE